MPKLRLKIDDHLVETDSTCTLLEAARSAGIFIPTLCYHPALEPFGACRLCSVEIEKSGRKKIVTACNYPVKEGLAVRTSTPEIIDIRKMIIELLLARCPNEKGIETLAKEYGVGEPRFKLDEEKCILCGLCTRVCEELVGLSAVNVISRGVKRAVDAPYSDLSEDCIACGSCALVCPTDAIKEMRNIFPVTSDDIIEVERRFLSGMVDEDLGVYQDLFAGKALSSGQDGGMVTSILASSIEKNLIDSAVVVLQKEGYGAETALVQDAEGVMNSRGTKYVRVSVISRLREALREGKKRVAVVGTPCQVRAVRKLQQQGYLDQEFPGSDITLIGLFCFESFDHRDLRAHTRELFGIDLGDAERIQIARGKFTVSLDGKDFSCSVKDLENDVREGCQFCGDFISRLADLSIGSVGSPDGCSTIIVRSEKGKKLLEAADFTRGEANREEIVKLDKMKRRKAKRHFAEITEGLEGLAAHS